jgi:hypothetical protein
MARGARIPYVHEGWRLAPSTLALAATAWLATCVLLSSCASDRGTSEPSAYREEISAGLEEIYVTRSIRTQYIKGATPACAAASFDSASEQHYDMWSLREQSSDARIVATHERPVGSFVACFGPLGQDGTLKASMQGTLGRLTYAGRGDCRVMGSKPPAPGLAPLACTVDLSALPDGYVGGYLTTSSLAPTQGAHVHGFLSTSVIIYRLWKGTPAAR